ncbi:MAG: hypothetical protein K8T89_23815 [Planctomycetes bacterium]|nr:hypothetical protein [Planctomycetota bacterium]
MEPAFALHTAARRYCLDQYAFWHKQMTDIARREADATREILDSVAAIVSRYNVLNAIRIELERIEPAKLNGLGDTRKLLILAGELADDIFTQGPTREVERKATEEERAAFAAYIRSLSLSSLSEVASLPYRRVLTDEESKSIWPRFRTQWQIGDGYWYPLADCTLPDVVAFNASAFEVEMPVARLQSILTAHGISRVWELREFGPEYEQDILLFEPFYNGAEGYWSSAELDWLIYASHESSVTVAGWLLHELKMAWPSWKLEEWIF